jgi:hypothetical protein
MSIQQIINEFQNYTYNKTEIISKYVKDLKNSGALDTNSLQIQEFLLPEIMLLMKKALVNRLSADLLFQNNYSIISTNWNLTLPSCNSDSQN